METRGRTEKALLGTPDSVLAANWLETFFCDGEYDIMLPWDFENKPQLPSRKYVLLLYFFYRGEFKRKSKMDIMKLVRKAVKKVWAMAGITTVSDTNLMKQLLKLLSDYQLMMKDSLAARHTDIVEQHRMVWVEELDKLFDCASPQVSNMWVKLKNKCLDRFAQHRGSVNNFATHKAADKKNQTTRFMVIEKVLANKIS